MYVERGGCVYTVIGYNFTLIANRSSELESFSRGYSGVVASILANEVSNPGAIWSDQTTDSPGRVRCTTGGCRKGIKSRQIKQSLPATGRLQAHLLGCSGVSFCTGAGGASVS